MALSNDTPIDTPIDTPKEDIYGLDPFARAITKSIEGMDAPEGLVLAINGPWGAGKSSAINLIRHHLRPAIENDEVSLWASLFLIRRASRSRQLAVACLHSVRY